jgi:hypothetical protein
MLLTGRMWWSVLTFNHPLQPQLPSVDRPFADTANARPHAEATADSVQADVGNRKEV